MTASVHAMVHAGARHLFERAIAPYRQDGEHVYLVGEGRGPSMIREDLSDEYEIQARRIRGSGADAFYHTAVVRLDARELKRASIRGAGAIMDVVIAAMQELAIRLYCAPRRPPKGWRLYSRRRIG